MNGNARNALPGLVRAGNGLNAALRWWLSELGSLVGDEARSEPARSDLILFLGSSGAGEALTLLDRRGETPRRYVLAAGADDLPERLAAIRGTGRAAVSVTVLVDPALCFQRNLHLPAAALPRMREVLAQELEASTPFRTEGVHADWYVEGEDETGLRVRHVLIKRARLDPVLAVLAGAGLPAGPVTVGPSEDRAMPVDLLSGGARPMPRLLRGLTRADGAALALAGLLLLATFGLVRAHQDATLTALETATLEARRAAPQRLAPPVQALAGLLAAERASRPPLAVVWSTLAQSLPDTASAESLRVGPEGVRAVLRTADTQATLRALRAAPGFGAVRPLEDHGPAGRLAIGMDLRPGAGPADDLTLRQSP